MKAVILDLGNVLITYSHEKTLAAIAEGAGCSVDLVHQTMAAMDRELTTGTKSVRDHYDSLVAASGTQLTYAEYLERLGGGITRDDRALAYAVQLQNRPDTTVAVITNTNDGHVRWLDDHLPELKELDLVIMSNEVGMGKPDAAIYALALELLDLPPENAIFVDDRAENVDGARALGMAGIVHSEWTETQPKLESWLADQTDGLTR